MKDTIKVMNAQLEFLEARIKEPNLPEQMREDLQFSIGYCKGFIAGAELMMMDGNKDEAA